jgi:N-succinyldiaminopimelate aminotransferase
MAGLPGMADRTLTISSAGKTFSVTGWKVGWMHGPRELVASAKAAKQFLTYVSGAPFQPAIATALGLPDVFYADLAADLQRKRDLLATGLRAAGFTVFPTGGHVLHRHRRGAARRHRRRRLLLEAARADRRGRRAVSVFCVDPDLGRTLVRFAFCKRDEVLTEAVSRLAGLKAAV